LFGILLKGKPKAKCNVCRGEGYVYNDGSLRTCRNCEGKGYVETLKIAEKALMRFSQPRIYRVSHECSTVLVYQGLVYDEVLTALRVLTISNIKAEIVFQI
jgi:RecJ-like exonuclease